MTEAPSTAMSEVGSREEVTVSELSSPDRLFIQRTKDQELVDWLAVEMDSRYTESEGRRKQRLEPGMVMLGNLVAAQWLQQGWHRARVTGFRSSSHVEVFYVDYGSRGVSGRSGLYRLPPELVEVPALALRASLLPALLPPSPYRRWPETSIAMLQALLQPGAELRFTATVLGKDKNSLQLQLITEQGADVAESLVREGLARLREEVGEEKELEEPAVLPSPLLGDRAVAGLCGRLAGQDFFPASLLPDLVSLVGDSLASASKLAMGKAGPEEEDRCGDIVKRTVALGVTVIHNQWPRRESLLGREGESSSDSGIGTRGPHSFYCYGT